MLLEIGRLITSRVYEEGKDKKLCFPVVKRLFISIPF